MTPEEARIIVLEDALEHSKWTIEFLVDCIDGKASHAYPEQTQQRIDDIEALIGPSNPPCVHSFHDLACESCRQSLIDRARLHDAQRVLAQSEEEQ